MAVYSSYLGSSFSNLEMHKVFSDLGRFQSWLDVEVTLAKVQGQLGIIPKSASDEISKVGKLENLDIVKMKEQYIAVGFPILPFVKQLQGLCDSESAKWVHWGATTQDIIDTGMVLQIKSAINIIESDLIAISKSIYELTERHRHTVMPGRTFKQHAAPITFGFKAAVWLDEILRHLERLKSIKANTLLCSYGGAVGNLAALGEQGIKVLDNLATELELNTPAITWHSARDNFTELVFWLSLSSASLSKIANEISVLMSSEINEVREPYKEGRGASSAMPQKRNPISCPIVIANATRLKDLVSSQMSAMNQDHERALAGQSLEWLVIPDSFLLASGVFMRMKEVLSELVVDDTSMQRNLGLGNGLIMSEAVMTGLAKKIGRVDAHKLVTEAASKAIENNLSLKDSLLNFDKVTSTLSQEEIRELFNANNYLGSSSQMISRVQCKFNEVHL